MNRWGPNKKPRPCDRGSHPSVIEDLETHPYGSAIRARSLVGILAQALTKRCGLLPVRAHRAAHAGCRSLRALDRRVSEWIEGLQTRGEAGGAAGVDGGVELSEDDVVDLRLIEDVQHLPLHEQRRLRNRQLVVQGQVSRSHPRRVEGAALAE